MLQRKKKNEYPRFEEVYRSLFPTIFRVSYRITGDKGIAEDLCHEAFIKYYEKQGLLPDIEQAKYWLIRVVRNISLNYEKRRIRERKAYTRFKNADIDYEESGEEKLIREETDGMVQKALDKLPYKLRVVLVLKEYAGLNYKEIGSILGISEGNVKIRVFRAREKLAIIFKEGEQYVS